ncbi:YbhB/YbcL family Raf kinase inhibitor-like protein [Acrocarpospora catenulata]|uniref:YbhB/YbcL family Raf kinase inhibitor-like protein n=1 Tax=Acrocarpospora catenulata TaxID=2836182 RepID=UPI001BD9841B|nr:YbhB/YbcL family Raf kinase inhibitor-like protein [Acrocarpospora catenulata]
MGSPSKPARRAAVLAAATAVWATGSGCGIVGGGSPANLDVISVSSPQFRDGDALPHGYSCKGQLGNPPLRWSGTSGAKSVALVVDDNDSRDGAEVHWVVYNIDPETTELGEGQLPRGARQGQTTSGKVGYVPPCRANDSYRFTVYALDAKLGLPAEASLSETLKRIAEHTIARGRLTATNIQ